MVSDALAEWAGRAQIGRNTQIPAHFNESELCGEQSEGAEELKSGMGGQH